MDSYEFNKIAGAVLGTVLLVMGLGIVGDSLYAVQKPEKPGYVVEMPDAEDGGHEAEEEAEAEISLSTLLGEGDADAGAKQAKKCAACHTFDEGGANKVGPNLHNIVGRTMGGADGFGYSDAIKARAAEGGTWTYESLFDFIGNPKGYLAGTNMAFKGIKRDGQRADLVVFLKEKSPAAPDLPVEEVEAEEAEEVEEETETSADTETQAPSAASSTDSESPPASTNGTTGQTNSN